MMKLENMDTFKVKKFTKELADIIEYINNNLLQEYPSEKVTPEYFILAVLNNESCYAYNTISQVMLTETIEVLRTWCYKHLAASSNKISDNDNPIKFDNTMLNVFTISVANSNDTVNSNDILYHLLDENEEVKKTFKLLGVTEEEIKERIMPQGEIIPNTSEVLPVKAQKVSDTDDKTEKTNKKTGIKTITIKRQTQQKNDEVEKNLINLNRFAAEGKIEEAYENDDIINEIFANLQKKYRNNVVLVGDSGCGKTCTVRHIANLITQGLVPKPFLKKQIMQLDFMSLTNGTAYRGSFETKFNAIIADAKKNGNYIFFLDDIHAILNEKAKFAEVDIETILETILSEKSIQFICTTNNKSYNSYIRNNPSFRRRFQKVDMEAPDLDKSIRIINNIKEKLETYHNVKYSNDIVETCAKLCKRYITDNVLPDSAINVLDKIGAKLSISEKDSEAVATLKNKLKMNAIEKEKVNNASYKDYNKYDELVKQEIHYKTQLSIAEKEETFNKVPHDVTEEELRSTISVISGIDIKKLSLNDMENIKNLNEKIKADVIGQDEAVDVVCNAIKKQKIGISNPDKPPVFLFTGSTGTGKTLLAKKIAKEVFGDEKNMVRLDMSEYSDKTSVTKLYGTGMGYVGYENGGILTDSIKKNKHCVLLLDEIEKANEEVHNVFLQLFDEGRLTDNTGYSVDFKNVIIIMTSNVGAKEVDEKGDGIGFVRNMNNNNADIISKAIKRKFKPEFINRINKIVYFNKLTDANLYDIIKLELKHFNERLENAGYKLSDNFIDDAMVEHIFSKIDNNKYGARTIIRQIETDVEDVITDYILNKNIAKGHIFTKEELF